MKVNSYYNEFSNNNVSDFENIDSSQNEEKLSDSTTFTSVEERSSDVYKQIPAYTLINKILATKDACILDRFGMDEEYIHDPYCKEIYSKIRSHYDKYGNVPDPQTLLSWGGNCKDFVETSMWSPNESNEYIADSIFEDHLFHISADVIQESAKRLESNANEGVEYLQSHMSILSRKIRTSGIDIISQARDRLQSYEKKRSSGVWYYSTGFPELDKLIEGWSPGEELVVLFARTGAGKSWTLLKMLEESWRQGFNVGLLEPEMTGDKIGYRFDTIYKHFSNRDLSYGKDIPSGIDSYKQYIEELSNNSTKFLVTHPNDFGGSVTVSKLESWCVSNSIKILAIDGVSYMKDERSRPTDSTTLALTNISADLMSLSVKLQIPVIVVVQSNREGAALGGRLALENIRDSDGIAYSASMVLGVYKKNDAFHLQLLKNRNGVSDITLAYDWDINTGEYRFLQEGEVESDADSSSDSHSYRPRRDSENTSYRPERSISTNNSDVF